MKQKTKTREQRSRVLIEPIWERQPTETKAAWNAFVKYRDAEERSHAKLAQELGKSKGMIDTWGRLWKWQERCLEFDKYVDGRAVKKAIKDRAAMIERHINVSLLMQQAAITFLQQDPEALAASLTPQVLPKYLDTAVKIERLSRGEATEVVDTPQQRRQERVERARAALKDLMAEFPTIPAATLIEWAMQDYHVAKHDLEDLAGPTITVESETVS